MRELLFLRSGIVCLSLLIEASSAAGETDRNVPRRKRIRDWGPSKTKRYCAEEVLMEQHEPSGSVLARVTVGCTACSAGRASRHAQTQATTGGGRDKRATCIDRGFVTPKPITVDTLPTAGVADALRKLCGRDYKPCSPVPIRIHHHQCSTGACNEPDPLAASTVEASRRKAMSVWPSS